MADKPDNTQARGHMLVERLVREAGITVAQARELVLILGHNWPSLIREARLLITKR
jgi:hypothetical protein